MDDEAFVALEAISLSAGEDLVEHEPWIKAFKAIRWVVQTETGLSLTLAGRQARDEMAAERKGGESPAGGHECPVAGPATAK